MLNRKKEQSITVRRIELKEFNEISQSIDDLLNNASQNNIFLTPDWLMTWWEFYGDDKLFYFLLAEQNNQLLGFAPLMITTQNYLAYSSIRILSFINSQEVAADHMEFVCLKGKETEVNNQLKEELILLLMILYQFQF